MSFSRRPSPVSKLGEIEAVPGVAEVSASISMLLEKNRGVTWACPP